MDIKFDYIDTGLLETESELMKYLLSLSEYQTKNVIEVKEVDLVSRVPNLHFGENYSIDESLRPIIERLRNQGCIGEVKSKHGNAYTSGFLTIAIIKPKIFDYYANVNDELAKRTAQPQIEQYTFNDPIFNINIPNTKPLQMSFGKNREEWFLFRCLFNAWRENKGSSEEEIIAYMKLNDEQLPKHMIKNIKANLIKRIARCLCDKHIFIFHDKSVDGYRLELKQ